MSNTLEKGKYYILSGLYVYAGHVSIEVPYADYNSLFFTKKHFTKYFAEYLPIKEPMLFGPDMREIFTNISVAHKYLISTQPNHSEGTAKDGFWRYWIGDFSIHKHIKPDSFLIYNSKCEYPFIHNFIDFESKIQSQYGEIKGTKLKELLIRISDTPNATTTLNLAFSRHTNRLNELYKRSCILANLPFKPQIEYDNIIAHQKRIEEQDKIRLNQKDANDDAQARLLLNRYKK